MKTFRKSTYGTLAALVLALGVVPQGCGGSESNAGTLGTGGWGAILAATGGSQATGSGGSSAISTTQATGGVRASGGAPSTGGFVATGGISHMGGAVATGGLSSAGGVPATGGASAATANGTGGTSIVQTVINSFDAPALEAVFSPNTYVPTDCSVNLGAPNDAGTALQAAWSGSVDVNADATTKGSMKITATFTGWDQSFSIEMNGPTDSNSLPLDLTNKTVRVSIEVESGISRTASAPFGGYVYVKTGNAYVWGNGTWVNMDTTGIWRTWSINMAAPQGVSSSLVYDPKTPVQLGILFHTGGAGESTYCAKDYQYAFGAPVTSVIYVDRITVENNP